MNLATWNRKPRRLRKGYVDEGPQYAPTFAFAQLLSGDLWQQEGRHKWLKQCGHKGQLNPLEPRTGYGKFVLSVHQGQIWPKATAKGKVLVALKMFRVWQFIPLWITPIRGKVSHPVAWWHPSKPAYINESLSLEGGALTTWSPKNIGQQLGVVYSLAI